MKVTFWFATLFVLMFAAVVFAQSSQNFTEITQDTAIQIGNAYLSTNESALGVRLTDLNLTRINYDSIPESGLPWTLWYSQYYKGTPVYEGGIGVYLGKDNNIYVKNQFVKNIILDVVPAISKEKVLEILLLKYGNDLRFSPFSGTNGEPTLFVAQIYEGDPPAYTSKLVWIANISLPTGKEVYVDAQTGSISLERQNWMTDSVVGHQDLTQEILVIGVIALIVIVIGVALFKNRKSNK